MGDEESVPPAIGKYRNVLLQYEANDHIYLYSSDGIPTAITANIPQEILDSIAELEATDVVLQQEIDDLKNSPDVVDIVPTYADLQAYDTSKLGDNDIIRVLQDEQHDGQSTYYRWNATTSSWTYIGAVGDYYTKTQIDTLLAETPAFKPFPATVNTTGTTQQFLNSILALQPDTGMAYLGTVTLSDMPAGLIQEEVEVYIYNDYVAYAIMRSTDVSPYAWWCASYNYQGWQPVNTDTTYSDFTGATSSVAGAAGLVPAPTTSDPDKFLKGDGTWGTPTDTTYTAGTNVQISAQNVISATDTTYSNFVGTDGQTAGTAGLVPAPATTDAGKFLKADGTWDTAGGGGPTVVQTTGTSTTDVMSQDATTKMIYPRIADYPDSINIRGTSGIDTATGEFAIAVGTSTTARGERAVSIGCSATAFANGDRSVAIGNFAKVNNNSKGIAIGNLATCSNPYSVALGSSATTSRVGEVNIGAGTSGEGYNSTNYRVIGGVHDGQDAHDAATVGQLNGRVIQNAGAPTTSTAGTVGQLLEDTTNGKLYICTDATNPYVWEEVGAGGGGTTEIEYVNCTLTGATATGFTLSADKTATQVKALVESGKEVIYKFVNSVSAGSVLAGTYEFSVLYAGTNTSVDVVTGYGVTSTYGSQTQDVYTFIHTSSSVDVKAGTIPTVNDATLTIQKNGTTVQTFTANASSNVTANIEVPTITMTTTDPGEGSALAADNFVAVYGGDPIIVDYSTSEINTGATWINGAPIYKKTISTGALPNATTKNVAHGISNLDLVIDIKGCAWDGSSTWLPIPNAGSSSATIEAYVYSSNIVIATGMDRTGFTTSYVTLYYTKSS